MIATRMSLKQSIPFQLWRAYHLVVLMRLGKRKDCNLGPTCNGRGSCRDHGHASTILLTRPQRGFGATYLAAQWISVM